MLFNLRVQLDNVQPFSGVFTSNLAWYVTPRHYYNIRFPIPFRQVRPRPAAVYSIVCGQFRRLLQHSAYLKIQQNEIIIVILIKQNIVVIITFLHLHGHAIEHRVWKMIKASSRLLISRSHRAPPPPPPRSRLLQLSKTGCDYVHPPRIVVIIIIHSYRRYILYCSPRA